MAFVEFLGRP